MGARRRVLVRAVVSVPWHTQLSARAIWAIPEEEEASVQLHQLPEATYHKVSWTLLLP